MIQIEALLKLRPEIWAIRLSCEVKSAPIRDKIVKNLHQCHSSTRSKVATRMQITDAVKNDVEALLEMSVRWCLISIPL